MLPAYSTDKFDLYSGHLWDFHRVTYYYVLGNRYRGRSFELDSAHRLSLGQALVAPLG